LIQRKAAALSVIVGCAAGLLGTAFRLGLQRAEDFRNSLAQWAEGLGLLGFLIVLSGRLLLPAWPLGWLPVFRPNRLAVAFPMLNFSASKNGQGIQLALLS
jgi:hypothetical protein